jgi:mono/diheme cytochrome c family protein
MSARIKEIAVKTTILSILACALTASLLGAPAFSQSSVKSLYEAKCQTCHGATGLANSSIGKMMKVKPVTDPSVYNMPDAEMIREVREGAGKMEPYKDSLSDAQIKALVDYFKTFIKKN